MWILIYFLFNVEIVMQLQSLFENDEWIYGWIILYDIWIKRTYSVEQQNGKLEPWLNKKWSEIEELDKEHDTISNRMYPKGYLGSRLQNK